MARVIILPVFFVFAGIAIIQDASAELGRASWYALTTPTASGERCNPNALTAAHPTLPFGTIVEVENIMSGRSIVVRINDRALFVENRIIDLTPAAATRLGFLEDGLASVRLNVLSNGSSSPAEAQRAPLRYLREAEGKHLRAGAT